MWSIFYFFSLSAFGASRGKSSLDSNEPRFVHIAGSFLELKARRLDYIYRASAFCREAALSRTMAPACVCAPSGHKGSFRCRQHRAAARSVASDKDSRSTVNQATATCLCAPTSHPGSFRCRLHRTQEANWGGRPLLPSSHAKSLRNSELPPAKSGDGFSLKKAAFARTNRASSESKLRSELNKAMPEIVAAVEDLRISPAGPVEILTKNGKLIVSQVPGAAMARASNNINQENTLPSDAVTVKGSTETINIVRSQSKGAKRPTSSNRRLRAKSDILLANML